MNQADAWADVKTLFEACLDAAPEERSRLLGNGVAPDVRAEVEALLAAQAAAPELDLGAASFGSPLFAQGLDAEDAAPERIGPYRVLRELGRGGMGVVYLAERDEAGLQQRVALKRIRGGIDRAELRARFRRERNILARLAHDRIARLFDGGVDGEGRPWFALEYVEGLPITAWCDARRLMLRERVRLFLDVLDGVAYAHRNLVVHRDLKSANVLVDDGGHIKLLDFGIAKLLEDDDADTTATGALLLTPSCAAPEQVRGEAVSTATDVYALGVLLYELATGLAPYRFDARSSQAITRAILEQEPERASRALARTGVDTHALAQARNTNPAALRGELNREFEQILGTALAKSPEQRYASVDALAADLRAWLERRPLLSRPTPRLRRAVQFVRRHRVGVTATALVLLTALAGVGATLWQTHIATRHAATERAVREFTTSLFAAIDPAQARGREVPLREVLDEGARRAENGLKDQPAVRGAMLSDLGAIYSSLGDDKRSIDLLTQARDTLAAAPDSDTGELAHSWLRLADAQFQQAQYAEAARSADMGLTLLAARPLTDALRAQAEMRRTRIDEESDHLDAANARVEKLVAALRADPATSPAALSQALATLGSLRQTQKRFEDALAAHSEALEISRRADPDDPIVASRLHELSETEAQSNMPKEGLAHLREAYAIRQKVYGPRHPQTLSTEAELAWALGNLSEFAEAEAMYKRTIEARRVIFGAQHNEVATPLNNYGTMLYLQHRYAEAVPLFAEALQIWTATLGPEHARTRQARNNYGGTLIEVGDLDRAEPLLRQAWEQSQKLDPPRGQGSPRSTYAILLERMGRLDEAEKLLRAGVASDIEAYHGDELRYPWSRALLGRVLRERGDLAGAREQLEKALFAYDNDEYPDGGKTATCLYQLALVREAQHEPLAQIRPLLERALIAQESKIGKDQAETVATRQFLARLPH